VGYIQDGDWISFSKVDFGTGGYSEVQARVASDTQGGSIEFRLGSTNGSLLGTLNIEGTGGWQSWVTESSVLEDTTGIQDLYLVFKGGSGYLFNLGWFEFTQGGTSEPSPDPTEPSDPSSPFQVVEGENFIDSSGITLLPGDGGTVVQFEATDSYIAFEFDFNQEPQSIDIRSASSGWGANVYFKLDGPDGQTFSTIYPSGGGSWHTNTNSTWPRPTGVKTVYITTNKPGLQLNWFEMK